MKPMFLATNSKALKKTIGMCLLTAMLLGCGKQAVRYPVSGKVMIDGAPLKTGSIRFVPEKGRPVTSAILSDGTFALAEASLSSDPMRKGVAPGKYRVAVSAAKVINEDADEVEWLAPSKYADFRTSEIAFEINGPQDDLLVDLTWEGNETSDALEEETSAVESPVDESSQKQESPQK